MRIRPQTTLLVSVCIVLTGIAFTYMLGLWTTQSDKIPKKLQQAENSDQYDPSDIRGSYTFSEISSLFDIPEEDLADAFLVDRDAARDFKCKDLEKIFSGTPYEIGTGSVRMFAAFYLGLPYDLTKNSYVTDSAALILRQQSKMTPEQLAYLETHTVTITPAS